MPAAVQNNNQQKPPTMSQAEIAAKVDEIVKSRLATTEPIILKQSLQVLDYSDMVVGKELGSGSFSCAYEIKRFGAKTKPGTPKAFVLKKLSKKVLANPLLFAACATDVVQEGKILASVNHPSIIQIKGWSGEDMVDSYLKGSRDRCYLVIERLDQNLEHQLNKWKEAKPSMWNLPSKRKDIEKSLRQSKINAVLQLARALEHLHQSRILHR